MLNKFSLILGVCFILASCQAVQTAPTAATVIASPTSPTAEPTEAQETPQAPQPTPTSSPVPQPSPGASATSAALSTGPAVTTPLTAAPTEPATTTAAAANVGDAIIVDRTAVELFNEIPPEYLEKARNLRVIYYNASVGLNLSEGLDCLASAGWAQSPPPCRVDYIEGGREWKTYTSGDLSAGRVPPDILFPADSQTYNRSNWVFAPRQGDWHSVTKDFVANLAPANIEQYDVLSFKITYLMVEESSNIIDPQMGFFVDQSPRYDIHDVEGLMAEHPDKTFFFWTSSLARSIGSQVALDFNEQMRTYAFENGLILFDIADIESHTHQGEPCFDTRDGVQSCANNGECENEPDDGVDLPAICQNYTTETFGGHLGTVAGGKIRVAKAFWVLMARIAGWQP